MHYVYILQSMKDLGIYIGRTDDLKTRFRDHTNGKVESTRYRRPLKLLFYEAFTDKRSAIRREKYLKTSKGKSTIKMMLRESLH